MLPFVKPQTQRANQVQPTNSHDIFLPEALEATLGLSDPEVLVEFFIVFLDFTGDRWKELEKASEAGDLAMVRDITHSLKSSSHSIGALALSHCFAELEHIAQSGDVERCQSALAESSAVFKRTMSAVQTHLQKLEGNLN